MDGFQKIELTSPKKEDSLSPEDSSVVTNPNKKSRLHFLRGKRFRIGLVVFILIFLIGIILPGFLAYASAKKTYAQLNATLYALKQQNIELASTEMDKTRESLKDTQRKVNFLVVLRVIPFVSNYYGDARHALVAGEHFVEAGDILIESIKPYADVLGLKGQGSFVGGSAELRIETAVKTMDKVTPKIDEIAEELTLAKAEMDYIDPDDYPSFLAGGKVKKQLAQMIKLTDNGVTLVNDAKPLIKVLPSLLGEPDEKKYLIIFQNDKELRPTGGFLTAYSIFTLEHGLIHVSGSNNIYTLDATVREKKPAPEPLKSLLKQPVLNIRDSNLSPDFVKSMEVFSEMYENSSSFQEVDGIIAVDTHALIAAINILGDIEVDGTRFTAKTDPRCDCPQAIYQLEAISSTPIQADFRYVDVNAVNAARKNIIGDLMYAILNKAFSSSPKIYWGPLFQEMLSQVNEKHIMFYLYNKEAQKGIDTVNASGRIKNFDGDYLHINEANFGGAKSNLFVTQKVEQEYAIKKDKTIEKTLTITYKNPFPQSDCNLERGGLCLNAPLKDWYRIYVPEGSRLVSVTGSQSKEDPYKELGKTVFEGFLEIRPQGARVLK
ncbi:MAG: hypothetical protein UU15_C0014G0014 [Candidatus Levybacteria bacterium GW2011_GWC2_40_7]|nr:MAG: hypothetical protein UU15_C0014G0014 [Candidatus Levybacteria bacterium GW2011_GWC2_40_7]